MASQIQNNGLANLVAGWVAYASRPLYLQWGVGSGVAPSANALDDTTGTTEARATGTASQQTTTVTGDTYQVVGTITAEGPRAITEVGVFDAAGSGSPPTGGNMDLYGDFAVINVDTDESIQFTVKTVWANA